jgi:O-antigen/teichoic acid export membrane protein
VIQQLIAGIRHIVVGTAADRLFGIISMAVLLRVLPLAAYGHLTLIYGLYAIVDLVAGLAQSDLVVARCSEARGQGEKAESARLFRSYLSMVYTTSAVVLAAGAVTSPIAIGRFPAVASLYWPALAGALSTPIRNLVLTHLRIEQNFRGIKFMDVLRSGVLMSGYVLLVVAGGLGLRGALLAYAASNIVLLVLLRKRGLAQAASALLRPTFAPMLLLFQGEGKWQLTRYAVVALHGSLRPWLIQIVLGAEAVGIFQAAKTVIGLPMDLLPFKEMLVPMMSHEGRSRERLVELFKDAARYATWVFVALAVAIVLVAPLLFDRIFPRYQEALWPMRIMALSFLTAGLGATQVGVLYALRLQWVYFLTTTQSLGLMVVLTPLFMWLWGVSGAAAAFVINATLITVTRQRVLTRRVPELRVAWDQLFRFEARDRQFVRHLLLGR